MGWSRKVILRYLYAKLVKSKCNPNYTTHNESKSVIVERYLRTLNKKI